IYLYSYWLDYGFIKFINITNAKNENNDVDILIYYYDDEIIKIIIDKNIITDASSDFLNYLLNKGNIYQNKRYKQNDGDTILHYMCHNNEIEIVKLLLKYNVDLDVKNDLGDTPLMYACKEKHIEIIKLLKEANPNIQNNYGDTPLNSICENNKSEYRIDIMKLVLDRGADPNIPNNSLRTPL